ncbi:efflux RND transporter periplasmic adaptor subunit [Thalassoglobus sp. JC818]|uniref:efflux RND transporter periplasmic adaptor subunit n=1 Tax=Thalassoglobus sp. JC818 TaxID=3232136 RepID=UPI003457FBBC
MQQQTTQSALVSTTERPVPLIGRSDLDIKEIEYRGVPYPVIKDPVGLKYYRLQPEQYATFLLLDGRRSLRDVRDELLKKFPTLHVTTRDVQGLVTDLHEKGLLCSSRLGQGEQVLDRSRTEKWKKIRQSMMNPLYIKLPGWDPERTLQRLEPWFGWMFTPPAGLVMMMFVASSWLFLAIRFDAVRQRLPEFQQFFGWPNLIYLWITLALAKILHEFGHGIACKHYGAECHSMGIMLLVFSPTLYCDVTDSWMLKNKWKRIVIGAAGMYFEMILAAAALFVWYNTKPGLVNHLALNIFFVSTVTTVIFNANPLLRYDGYYMMSDWLEIPNLRSKATKMLSETFSWWTLGIESPVDPFMPTTGKAWFVLFAIASSLYRWFVLFAITIFLYTVLKPYRLQSLGILLAVGSLVSIAVGMGVNFYKLMSRPRQDPISRVKVFITGTIATGLIALILFVPFPWFEEAAFYIEPANVSHVYSVVPGFVEEVFVRPGDHVIAGQEIATLKNPQLFDEEVSLTVEEQAQGFEPEMYRQLADPDGQRLAERRLETIEEHHVDVREQLEDLKIVAPVAGTVVAPNRRPQSHRQDHTSPLQGWYGSPLSPENTGAYLDEQTSICSIAPSKEYLAILLINQSDREDLGLKEAVRLKVDSLPERVWQGRVIEFSDRHLEYAPPALSNKFGGPLATVTDAEGREQLAVPVYQAKVEFDAPPEYLRTGMRGTARFVVAERTLFNWFWRWFRQTFHFRL